MARYTSGARKLSRPVSGKGKSTGRPAPRAANRGQRMTTEPGGGFGTPRAPQGMYGASLGQVRGMAGGRPGAYGVPGAGVGIAQRALGGAPGYGGGPGAFPSAMPRPSAGMVGASTMRSPAGFARMSPTWQGLGGATPSSAGSLPNMTGAASSGYFNPGAYANRNPGQYGGPPPVMPPGGYGTPSMGSPRAVPGPVGY